MHDSSLCFLTNCLLIQNKEPRIRGKCEGDYYLILNANILKIVLIMDIMVTIKIGMKLIKRIVKTPLLSYVQIFTVKILLKVTYPRSYHICRLRNLCQADETKLKN